MKSPIQRRVAIAALLLAPALGACGFSAQTDQVYQPAVGPNDRSGQIQVLNAVIVTNGGGQGTFAGSLVNKADAADAVTNVTGDSGVTAKPGGPLDIPAYGAVNLSKALEPSGAIPLVISGADQVVAGKYVTLTFTFTHGNPVTMKVPVVDETAEGQDYQDVPLPAADTEPSSAE